MGKLASDGDLFRLLSPVPGILIGRYQTILIGDSGRQMVVPT